MVSDELKVPTTICIRKWNQYPRQFCIPYLGDGDKTSVRRILKSLPSLLLAYLTKESYQTSDNQGECLLLQLPIELLLVILGHTSPLMKLCIRRVCRTLRACVARLEHAALAHCDRISRGYIITSHERTRYILMIRRDKYRLKDQPLNYPRLLPLNTIFRGRANDRRLPQGRIHFCSHISFFIRCLYQCLRDLRYVRMQCNGPEHVQKTAMANT